MTPTSDPWAERFTRLWPTYIIQRHLATYEQQNPALAEIVTAMDAQKDELTTDYKGVDFLQRPEPAIAWLREEINATLRGYLQTSGISYSITGDLQGWPNLNRRGDYHGPHNHGWSYLSGTYYVQVPEETSETSVGENSMRPAAITFSDPRQGAYRHSLADDPNARGRFTVHPKPGTLLLWPSPLIHYVHPNHADDIRISISFNIVLQWNNDYAG